MYSVPLAGSKLEDVEQFQRIVVTEIIENKMYENLKELFLLYWISNQDNLQNVFPEKDDD